MTRDVQRELPQHFVAYNGRSENVETGNCWNRAKLWGECICGTLVAFDMHTENRMILKQFGEDRGTFYQVQGPMRMFRIIKSWSYWFLHVCDMFTYNIQLVSCKWSKQKQKQKQNLTQKM